jgi:hypothetical protein
VTITRAVWWERMWTGHPITGRCARFASRIHNHTIAARDRVDSMLALPWCEACKMSHQPFEDR